MANKKFSEFVLKTSTSDVSHIVGYNGAENVQITPANFVTTGGTGVFLPLAGGTMTGTTNHNDSVYSYWGTGQDLQIGHDGSNSYIIDKGAGDLLLYYSDDFVVSKQGTSEVSIRANQDSSVELFFDNAQKFETTSTGISVTGSNNRFIVDSGSAAAIDICYVGSQRTIRALETGGGNARQLDLLASDFIFKTDAGEKMRLDSSGNLGVGTSTPQLPLHIEGATGSQVVISAASDSVGTTAGILLRAEAGESNSLARVKSAIFFERIAGTYGNGDLKFAVNSDANNDTVTVADTKMTINSSGNLGVGTSTPRGILDIGSTGDGALSNTTSQYQLILEAPSGTGDLGRNIGWSESTGVNVVTAAINAVDDGASSATGLTFSTGDSSSLTERMRIDSTGLVNITNNLDYSLRFSNQSAYNSGINNGIVFNGKYTSGGSVTDMASIRGGKDNTVDTHFGGKLTFHTRQNGGVDTKRMEIDSIGNAAIGTTVSSTNRLSVGGIIKSAGNNNYQNILTKEGSTGTFTFNFSELGNGISDNVSYFIMVTVYRPTTDVENDVATLLLHGIMPRGGSSVFNTINTLLGTGISVLTATNSGNSLVITTDSNVNLRCALTLTTVGGTS